MALRRHVALRAERSGIPCLRHGLRPLPAQAPADFTARRAARHRPGAARPARPPGPSVYNAAQRAAYLALIVALVIMVLSGLAIWKPVQLHWLAMLMGDYEGARYVHFLAMAAIAFIVFVHVMMVVLVPRTLPTMITGRLKQESARAS